MRRIVVFSGVMWAAWLVTIAAAIAQPNAGGAGRRGRGFLGGANQAAQNRPGRFMQLMYLERAWLAVSFELGATEDQLLKLRPIFLAAWETRNGTLSALQGGDRAGLALRLSEITDQLRKDIDNGLAQVLTEEQLAKWEELKANPVGLGPFGLFRNMQGQPFRGAAAQGEAPQQ